MKFLHRVARWLAADLFEGYDKALKNMSNRERAAQQVAFNFQVAIQDAHQQMEKLQAGLPVEGLGLSVVGAAPVVLEGEPIPVANMTAEELAARYRAESDAWMATSGFVSQQPFRRHVFTSFQYAFGSKAEAEHVGDILRRFIYEVVAKFVDVFERLPPTAEQENGFVGLQLRYAFAGPLKDQGPRIVKGCDSAYYEETADGTKFTDIE